MALLSKNSSDYVPVINGLNKPTYSSKYGNQLDNVVQQILNRPNFSYDFGTDPLSQQYKQQYVELGKDAVQNAISATTGLTGGYGNSYAGTAASQANQQYITEMSNQIPALMDAAMRKYQMEQDNLQDKFGALQSEESRLYGQYRDEVSDYYTDYNKLASSAANAISQENTEANLAYQKERAEAGDKQWQEKFEYQKARDAVADLQWEKEFELKKLKEAASKASGRGRRSGTSKTTTTDNVVNAKGMTVSQANKHMTYISTLGAYDAREYIKGLQQDGYITKDEANYLWLEYQKLPKTQKNYTSKSKKADQKHSTRTTYDLLKDITKFETL